MIAYKATYNFKCRKQEYKVGKTYTSDRMSICEYGIHFCWDMHNVLNHYSPREDFILLEIEILGKVETTDDKSVTDKIKVLRVVPEDEYTDKMKSTLSQWQFDDRGNMISRTDVYGRVTKFEYDERNNKISTMYSNGNKYIFEYDERNNKIATTLPSGLKHIFKYNDRNRLIYEKHVDGSEYSYEYDDRNNLILYETDSHKYVYEYDDRNNCISQTDKNGNQTVYEYDERNNLISSTLSDGLKVTYTVAIITEE